MFNRKKKEEEVIQISRKFILTKEIKLDGMNFSDVDYNTLNYKFKTKIIYHIEEVRTYSDSKEESRICFSSENFEETNKLFNFLNNIGIITDPLKFHVTFPTYKVVINNNNKTLFFDMDGVVADFNAAIKSIDPTLETGDGDDYSEREKKVDEIVKQNRDIFYNLPPYEGAIEAVNELSKLYDIYFLSTPMYNIPESYSGKRVWLEKHFGDLAKKRLILTHRKDLIKGDFLVDDRMCNGVENFSGVHIHFRTEKFPDWKVTLEYLKNQC